MRTLLLLACVGCGSVQDDAKAIDAPPGGGSDGGIDASDLDAALDAPPGQHTIPANAALHLAMDDSATDGATDSGGNHTTTCTGAACPTLAVGKFGQGYQFDGNDQIAITSATDIDGGNTTAYTVSLWFKPDVVNKNQMLISKAGAVGPTNCRPYEVMLRSDGKVQYTHCIESYTGQTTITAGQWHHLVIVWDHSATFYIAIDGADGASYDSNGAPASTAPIYLGATPGGNAFTGTLDDVVAYQRQLSAAELQDLETD